MGGKRTRTTEACDAETQEMRGGQCLPHKWLLIPQFLLVTAHIPDGGRRAVVCQDGLARKRAPRQPSLRLRGPRYHCAGSCSASPVRHAASVHVWSYLLLGRRHLKGGPSPRLLDICPEINWTNPLLGRIGWRICVRGG